MRRSLCDASLPNRRDAFFVSTWSGGSRGTSKLLDDVRRDATRSHAYIA